ncbi:MAG: polyisoprenoid-binding protein [Burkholderiaceae bacterium]|jgi:polyisoprenoid-binding protein YceI|nr:polyisoprenoid-binding protein [Burkholderiaceae bacterium]NDG06625.1 polyisoprenoid-binding protein [Oxalobacteraceae bacterium]
MKMMSKLLATVLLSAAVVTPVFAAPATYGVEPNHTFPRFSYTHLGFTTQQSRFDKTTGTVVYDKEGRAGSVDITIDTRSVSTGSALFNQHIQAEDFLDTAKYPNVTFKSTKVNFDGDKPVSIEGDLTMKGITKRVTLTVTRFLAAPHPIQKKDTIGADAYTIVKRTDFNMGKYAPAVSDEVRIDIAIEAMKQ